MRLKLFEPSLGFYTELRISKHRASFFLAHLSCAIFCNASSE